jgi:protein-S-isoprenylcysteine O-methyltransferase Ste14
VLLSGRLRDIESKINSISRSRLLIWESAVIPKFFGSVYPHPGVLNPGPIWASMLGVIFVVIGLFPSIYTDICLWQLSQGQHWIMKTAVIVGLLVQLLAICISIYVSYSVMAKMRERVSRWFIELT